MPGEVTLEEGFVEGDVLDRDQILVRLARDHPIHQQKGKAVRQHRDDAGDVERIAALVVVIGHGCSQCSANSLRISWSRRLKRAALRRQSLCAWSAVPE